VKLAVTPDGANTFHSRTQISIGIKITDTRALHCKTKAPVFVPVLDDDVGDGTGYFKGVQSSEMCMICIMADAKDKSAMYAEVFSLLYQYTDALQTQGMAASEHGLPYIQWTFLIPLI
jgi:hypothetical protein